MTKLKFFASGTLIAGLITLLTSCGSSKDILYFQGTENIPNTLYRDDTNPEVRIMPNDNLFIKVSAPNPLAAEPYNLINLSSGNYTNTLELQGYLVDENGNINFPGIGRVHVGGLTKAEVIHSIQTKLSQYLEDPIIVNVRFLNYSVSILGEVVRPGTYQITDERISVPEALAKAGDMTIYGQRHDILICRVENGEKKFYHLDITSPDIFFSEAYYLQQNDIVYVQPNKARTGSASVSPLLSTYLSIAGLLISVTTLVVNLTNK
ncbi:polysaccharide export outer membrane protein [Bacteroidia bacterium]|nr:polysaccharide export outer membrane protein [Bacteroidia bacterium]GHT46495.1 polysaccharide export outer membrane protein [Bacteroidia bacterium]